MTGLQIRRALIGLSTLVMLIFLQLCVPQARGLARQAAKSTDQQVLKRAWEVFNAGHPGDAEKRIKDYLGREDDMGRQAENLQRHIVSINRIYALYGDVAKLTNQRRLKGPSRDACEKLDEIESEAKTWVNARSKKAAQDLPGFREKAGCRDLLCPPDIIQSALLEIRSLIKQGSCSQAETRRQALSAQCPNNTEEVDPLAKDLAGCRETKSAKPAGGAPPNPVIAPITTVPVSSNPDNNRALYDNYISQARAAFFRQEYSKARQWAQSALQVFPTGTAAKELLIDIGNGEANKMDAPAPAGPTGGDRTGAADKGGNLPAESPASMQEIRAAVGKFYQGEYSEAKKRLGEFLNGNHSPRLEALAHFYLGATVATECMLAATPDDAAREQAVAHFVNAIRLWGTNQPPEWPMLFESISPKLLDWYRQAKKSPQ
jgi:TolA-binding protein